ncbi:blue light receptor [Podila epigama]|nr:blue light receptor [Podila epigama]
MDPAPHQASSQEPVHCFWALMTYGDLRFIYLSSSVQRAVSAKYKQLLGKSFFDYIHPDEAKLARKDLNAFMDVHNLYGSVTRFHIFVAHWWNSCRFKNVCPEWQQRRLSRHSRSSSSSSNSNSDNHSSLPSDTANALQTAVPEDGISSRGLGQGDRQNSNDGTNASDHIPSPASTGCESDIADYKNYEHMFPNGEAEDFMILDVVMNVVSDEVVLGFFHIDGQGLYKGFWSNGICGESKESLPTLAPEILRHLQDSVHAKAAASSKTSTEAQYGSSQAGSPPKSPRRQTDSKTKRIFQLYDSQHRNLLLTWPEPGQETKDSNTMAYNPELYTHIVKSHHIPTEALENTTCLKRFCSKHALPSLSPSSQEPSYQVESVFIPYGHIIFACFQTSPSTPANTWTSISSSPNAAIAAATTGTNSSAHPALSSPGCGMHSIETDATSDPLSGLGLLSSPGQLNSSMFPLGGNSINSSGNNNNSTSNNTTSPYNQPLVIPSLPSLSPFLKHASAGQMTMSSGAGATPSIGAIRNSGSQSSQFHPYSRHPVLSASSSGSSSPSSLPLPEAMQESLSFLNDYKAGDYERESGTNGRSGLDINENSPHSLWRASTPHPAIAAMVGHALSPSAPTLQRAGGQDGRSLSGQRLSALQGDESSLGAVGPLGSAAEIAQAGSAGSGSKHRKNLSAHRHPAHDAVIRKRTSPVPPSHHRNRSSSSSSPPSAHQELDTTHSRKEHTPANSHGGLVLRINQEEKACESCHTTNSPEWRRGPSGKKDLCNACGLRYSRSVARQNRQAQKQLEANGGGGGVTGKGAKAKTPKTPKTPKTAGSKKQWEQGQGQAQGQWQGQHDDRGSPEAGHRTNSNSGGSGDNSGAGTGLQSTPFQSAAPSHAGYPANSFGPSPGAMESFPVGQPSIYNRL